MDQTRTFRSLLAVASHMLLKSSVVQGAANQPPRGGNRGRFPPQLLAASRANFAAADYMQKISNVKFERFIFKYLCTFETGSMQFSYVTPHTAYKVFLRQYICRQYRKTLLGSSCYIMQTCPVHDSEHIWPYLFIWL